MHAQRIHRTTGLSNSVLLAAIFRTTLWFPPRAPATAHWISTVLKHTLRSSPHHPHYIYTTPFSPTYCLIQYIQSIVQRDIYWSIAGWAACSGLQWQCPTWALNPQPQAEFPNHHFTLPPIRTSAWIVLDAGLMCNRISSCMPEFFSAEFTWDFIYTWIPSITLICIQKTIGHTLSTVWELTAPCELIYFGVCLINFQCCICSLFPHLSSKLSRMSEHCIMGQCLCFYFQRISIGIGLP